MLQYVIKIRHTSFKYGTKVPWNQCSTNSYKEVNIDHFVSLFKYNLNKSTPVGCVPSVGVLGVATRCQYGGWEVCVCVCVPKMNKFEQVSSDNHQMSVVWIGKGGGRYPRSHIWTRGISPRSHIEGGEVNQMVNPMMYVIFDVTYHP